MAKDVGHRWRFFRAGGVDQPRLDTGADILALENLDQKLWVALSCPVKGLDFDEKTLALIDSDKDGRVRVKEVIEAIKWAAKHLKSPDELVKEADALPLDAIDDSKPEGKAVLASARQILTNLGKADAAAITVEDCCDVAKIFGQTKFNGDGIITAASAADATTAKVIADIIATHGSVPDRSGAPGIDGARVEAFFADALSYTGWCATAEKEKLSVLPMGDGTAAAYAACSAVKAKVDDYFARCRLAAFDARALAALNRQESDYLAVAAKDFTITAAEVSGFPLSKIEAGRPLPLGDGLNPAWADAIGALRMKVVEPLLGKGKDVLSAEDWAKIGERLGRYEAWIGSKAGAPVEKLGLPRIREILKGDARKQIEALIAKDKALEPESTSIGHVERLARYHRDLHRLLVNFVSFEDFYSRRRKAVFQAGTLYLDGRSCDLCVRVDDSAKHATLAPFSKTYLAYCDCLRPSTGDKMSIAAAFTGGDSDHLMVGRNGVFYDRKGNDWDATITRTVENPISIRQAFWSPYKRLLRYIEEQVAKRAAAADAAATEKLTSGASTLGKAAGTGKVEGGKKLDIGVVAAIGVAVGGITAAFGYLLEAFFGLGIWMPLGILSIILLISGPSMLIAWLKLRQRNLGPILDANGWAVNGRVRINVPFGGALTAVAALPPGAKRSLTDPYAVKRSPWPAILLVLIGIAAAGFILNHQGYIYRWTNGKLGKKTLWAAVEAKPLEGDAPLKVDFSGTRSTAPDGQTLTWNWFFGDGSMGSGEKVSHEYTKPGDYTATLFVLNGKGGSSESTVKVVAKAPPDAAPPAAPGAEKK